MKLNHFLFLLDVGHEAFHRIDEPGPDDPVTLVSLNERDILLIGMALPSLEALFYQLTGEACFNEASRELQERLLELVREQNPDWTPRGREAGKEEA